MDKSLINQTNLDFSNGLGNAKINIYNGRLLYELPCLKIGAGNFEIATSLIYNSHYKVSDFGSKIIGFGNGFKLNIHQYVFPYVSSYNINEFQVGDYVYIDEVWNTHRFVLYKTTSGYDNNSSVYYDASGSGLRLLVRNNGHSVIYDGNMNSLLFNSYGMLENIVSAINPLISKTITYNGTNISSIYDSRKSSRRINFTYNNGKLSSISISNNGTFLNFDYDDTLISKISKSISSKSKDLVFFLYDNYRLNYIVSAKDLLSLFFYYDNSSNKRVVTLRKGVMRKEIITSQSDSCNYAGENNYIGENNYVKSKGISKVGEYLSMPSNYVKNETRFSYGSFFTDVTNDKNITTRYMFNVNGFTSSIFEYNFRYNNYKTLFKTGGWTLFNEGVTDEKINGKKVFQLTRQINNDYYSYEVDQQRLTNFLNIFVSNGDNKYSHVGSFVVSFWVKFSLDLNTVLKAKVSYVKNNESKVFETYLDKTKANAWQYVTIPVDLGENQENISSIKVDIDYVNNSIAYIADMRIAIGNETKVYFVGTRNILLKDIRKVQLVEQNNTYSYDLSAGVFITESDIFATYKSMFFATKENKTNFDFVYCSGTKVKSVSSVSLFAPAPNYLYDDEYIPLVIDNYGTPNYYLQSVTTMSDQRRHVVEIINRFYKESGKYYFEVNNYMQLMQAYNNSERVYQDFCANKIEQRYDNGLLKMIRDEYWVFNKYQYDSFGNLESIEKLFNNENKRIKTIYDYGSVTNINRELPKSIISSGIRRDFNYIEPEMLKEYELFGNSKKTFLYDDYKENITSIKSSDITNYNEVYNNVYRYDNFGRLKSFSDKSNRTIGYIYNAFGEPVEFYENGKLVLEKSIEKLDSYDLIIDKIYNKEKIQDDVVKFIPFINETRIDSYGRIVYQKNINDNICKNIEYKYQDDDEFAYENTFNDESKSVCKIRQIIDPYENTKYNFTYDEDNRPCGYTIDQNDFNNDTKFEVRQISNENTEYYYSRENDYIVSKIIKEDLEYNQDTYSKYFNPRIKRTKYVKINARNNDEEEDKYKDYNYEYKYDVLGRLTNKVSEGIADGNNSWDNKIYIDKEIEYKDIDENETSIFPESISYTIHSKDNNSDDTASIVYDNVFDSRGNLIMLERSGERFDENPIDEDFIDKSGLVDRKYLYNYDAFNRLTREVKYEDTSLIETIEYDYAQNSDKLRKVKKNSNIIKEFSYTNGKITKYKKGNTLYDIDYDNYGNIRRTNCATIEYDSRNLLSKYSILNLNNYQNTSNYLTFSYNYQGVRFNKYINSISKNVYYYNEGSRIVGEDWIFNNSLDNKHLRYFYDAEGVCGLSYDGCNFNFIKDSLGSVTKILYQGKVIGEYVYDAWGNSTIIELSISSDPINGARDRFVLYNNPFRWKSHYLDTESGVYYVNGRYYSPELMIYLNALEIERINSSNANSLNRNAITMDNSITFETNSDTIFTSEELFADPTYIPVSTKSWWELNWKKAVQWIAFGTVLLVSIVLMCIPATSAFGVGMFVAGLKAAASGAIIGGIVGGVMSAIHGNNFLEGLVEGAVYGFINGFTTGALLFCASQAIGAVSKAASSKKLPEIETRVHGKAHGSYLHKKEIYNQVDKMIDSHTYTDIYLNRSLSTTGVAKNCYLRPDIIGKRIDDVFDIVEVASESQAIGQQLNVLVSHVDFYKTIDVVDKVILIKWGY